MLFQNGASANRVANDVILERILIRNSRNRIVSQFHVRSIHDKDLRSSHVIFTEGFFNVSRVERDRMVLVVWASRRDAYAMCWVFAKEDDAKELSANISRYTRKDMKIQRPSATNVISTFVPLGGLENRSK